MTDPVDPGPADAGGLGRFIAAARFAAERHARQKRKGASQHPYVNHLLAVADLLWRVGGVRDPDLLVAALLHDSVEDVGVEPGEIAVRFGPAVRDLVLEVTDDKALTRAERKAQQVVQAGRKSPGARQLKLADKICNLADLAQDPPVHWDRERRVEYLNWSAQVGAGLRGVNPDLERLFDDTLNRVRALLARDSATPESDPPDPR